MINVYISVKCGKYNSDFFQTDTGVPQGDCASANEFTFYLAKALLPYWKKLFAEEKIAKFIFANLTSEKVCFAKFIFANWAFFLGNAE